MITLAADIGGTSIKLGLVEDGRVLARDRLPVIDHSRLAPLLKPMTLQWQAMLTQSGRTLQQAKAVVLAFAGVVNVHDRRIVATNEKFTDGPALNLCEWVQDALGLPLWIDNDARVALIGEWRAGAGQGTDDLAMLVLGTGIGTAAVMNGQVVRGSHGMAGMLGGHLTLKIDGRRCTCGNIGCAEAEASTDRLGELVDAVAACRGLTAQWTDESRLDYALIFSQAEAGDPLALAVRDYSLRVWSAAVVNLIHAYGPKRVVLGGGIVQGSPQIVPAVQAHVSRYAWTPWGEIEICSAQLGDDAALIGCGFIQTSDRDEI